MKLICHEYTGFVTYSTLRDENTKPDLGVSAVRVVFVGGHRGLSRVLARQGQLRELEDGGVALFHAAGERLPF